jgi:hypothetical protein
MQQTIESTSEAVATASARIERFSERLIHLFSYVPDDRLTWTPSPTAKSSLRIVAHCALVSRFFANIITESMPVPMPLPEEYFKSLYEAEEKIATREGAVALVTETTAELRKALETVNGRKSSSAPNSPFGPIPMAFWVDMGSEHLADHVGQLEYLQTIWGDLDNHLA